MKVCSFPWSFSMAPKLMLCALWRLHFPSGGKGWKWRWQLVNEILKRIRIFILYRGNIKNICIPFRNVVASGWSHEWTPIFTHENGWQCLPSCVYHWSRARALKADLKCCPLYKLFPIYKLGREYVCLYLLISCCNSYLFVLSSPEDLRLSFGLAFVISVWRFLENLTSSVRMLSLYLNWATLMTCNFCPLFPDSL